MGAREEYLEQGFDDYLSKPVNVAELERVLAKYLPEGYVSYRSAADEEGRKEEKAPDDGDAIPEKKEKADINDTEGAAAMK